MAVYTVRQKYLVDNYAVLNLLTSPEIEIGWPIDIADVDVGENVGAKLQEAQAEANKSIAQAQAEIRRAAAVAVEQEMKARVQEMQAEVVRAQSEVPKAMAEAFRSGRLGVMDYYKMENVQADSAMRQSIAKPEEKKLP